MYQIDAASNRIHPIKPKTFTELKFQERAHLQEWLANQPDAMGEDLLIIQKEFSGFEGTMERLDLLALDTSGRLVIIENKLDDSGRDVIWQALKYAAYCSTLKTDQIIDIYQSYLGTGTHAEAAEIKAEIVFETGDKDLNKSLFDAVHNHAGVIEAKLQGPIEWLRKPNIKRSQIMLRQEIDGLDRDNWPKMVDWHLNRLAELRSVLAPIMPELTKIARST